jgi:hypothetical protein
LPTHDLVPLVPATPEEAELAPLRIRLGRQMPVLDVRARRTVTMQAASLRDTAGGRDGCQCDGEPTSLRMAILPA